MDHNDYYQIAHQIASAIAKMSPSKEDYQERMLHLIEGLDEKFLSEMMQENAAPTEPLAVAIHNAWSTIQDEFFPEPPDPDGDWMDIDGPWERRAYGDDLERD